MNSVYYVIQVALVAALATLITHHLQLRQKYEELKLSCESSITLGTQYQEGKVVSAKSRPPSKSKSKTDGKGSSGIFSMHSSSRDNNERSEKSSTQGDSHYVDEYGPTLSDKKFDEKVSSNVFSSQSFSQDAGEAVVETETSVLIHADDEQLETKTEENENKVHAHEYMASTNEQAAYTDPSKSLTVVLTEKGEQPQESLLVTEMNMQHRSSDSVFKTARSVRDIIQIQRSDEHFQGKEDAFDVYDEKIKNVNENIDKITVDVGNNSDAHHENPVDLQSSESTKEEQLHVFRTSLEQKIDVETDGEYSYFETHDATTNDLVINTDQYYPFDDITESSDYLRESEDDDENMYENGEDDLMYSEDEEEKDHKQNADFDESFDDVIVKMEEGEKYKFMSQGTSVFCDSESQMVCRFQNLCYNTKERDFVFFQGEGSQMDITRSISEKNIFDINLCSVEGHNTAMFSVVTLPTELVEKFSSIGIVKKRALTISRFKPDNIMHVLHDDVLPLFDTLTHHGFARQDNFFDAAIIFTDNYEGGSYRDFYSSLSTVPPIHPWKFNQTYNLLCFPDIQVGLQTSTVWYQYGFFQHQGPVHPIKHDIMDTIRKATDYLSAKFNSECFLCRNGNYLVFLRRKDNRLILNDSELIMSLIKSTKLKVMSVSLETHSLSEIITIIRKSRGVFGMHGSLLSLSLFLRPGSIIIELFPFAVNPSKYTPFKTFSDLQGSRLVYKSWSNPSKEKSVPHPDWSACDGGIEHLPRHEQEEISAQTEVPDHLCCEDPSWLYHIYQDTHVDIDAVVLLVSEAILESKKVKKSMEFDYVKLSSFQIPGCVKDLRCMKVDDLNIEARSKDNTLYIVSWDSPWVIEYDSSSTQYEYEIALQQNDGGEISKVILSSNELSYQFHSKGTNSEKSFYNIWVRVISSKGVKGAEKFVKCAS